MRTNVAHIHAIGDIIGQPMLAHKAVHEGHVAAEVGGGDEIVLRRRGRSRRSRTPIPKSRGPASPRTRCKAQGIKYAKAMFPWAASGRAIANGRDEGFTKLLFDDATHRVIGGGIVGTHAGDLISEISLAIEMGCDAVDIGKTIHPHPTLSESIGMAAEAVRRRLHGPSAGPEEVASSAYRSRNRRRIRCRPPANHCTRRSICR